MRCERASPVSGCFRSRPAAERRGLGVGLALIVGEAPNLATVGRPAAWLAPDGTSARHAGNRLARWSGLRPSQFLRLFDRTNLFEEPREPWPLAHAWDRAQLMYEATRDSHVIVLLGRKVSDACGLGNTFPYWYRWRAILPKGTPQDAELSELLSCLGGDARFPIASDFEIARRRGASLVACVPHPSSRSRLWNAPEEHERARFFWSRLAASLAAWAELLQAAAASRLPGPPPVC